ncbi:hypothetical protein POPTR_006G223300v4 [Populus trichocarpa]|jgi:pentatricopeptide repeat protein|uniref:Pentacotripeptide-repeat region of PRORP domain-containing protein n=1 Tax=Populus trichocarpa TaxID=3694 RepID=A0A2K2A6B9_POPTR|nr:pentatricopeptide repeat-containing protein At5g46100 [Populus trichocarpa]KAI5586154.1 hypothetical protein BDE02_06G194300 [Populus trichocarpa]PNT33076.2 hypothetical protein POPTR_006G223300v4 [Populus trichocarpa]|eukprot:XP_002308534.1 pentatricopeptide repeat-containing protein At5g46100 [Populus trichocarpa]
MAMPPPAATARTLTRHPRSSELASLVTAITSCLETLNPQNPNPKHINPTHLNQFSPHLDSNLVIEVIKEQQPNPYQALFFFNWASNLNPNPNNYSHNHRCYVAIIDLLLSHSLFPIAKNLLEKHGTFSDLLVSKLIRAYGYSGDTKSAIFWFHKVKEIQQGKCLFSWNAILGVLVKVNQINVAKSFFDQIVNDAVVKPDASTYTTMIRGFCKVGMIDNARKVFDEMICEPNLITCNTLINGYCKKGDMENARIFLCRMMESKDCLPDTVTYSTLIDGYCKKGELNEARKWMDGMLIRGCNPNLWTYNAIIYGLCLRGNVDEARRLLTKMRLNGVKENVATHLSILKGLSVAGKSEEAIGYFSEMIRKGMKLDAKEHEVVITAYCKMRKPDEAISLLKEMQAKGISRSVGSFNAVLRILVEIGELDKAVLLLKQVKNMGCLPNLVSYSTVICGLCRSHGRMQEVAGLVDDMLQDGFEMDATLYSCLVGGFCEAGNEEMAMRAFYDSINKNYVINLQSFSFFVNLMCGKGKVIEAEQIFKDMCRRCSLVDVDSYQRVLDDQLHKHSGRR